MSWYSKVFWSEGLFLRPHHLQQNDRYVEHLLEKRVRVHDALSVGLCPARDRPRSHAAEQVRGAPRRRRHAGRNAVRHPGGQPDAGRDRGAGYGRRPDRLADDAGRRTQHPRGRRGSHRQRQPLRSQVGDVHRLDLALRIEEEIDIAYPRLVVRTAQDQQARIYGPRHRAHSRGARQEHPVRRQIRAADAGLRRASDHRRLAQPRHRLDRDQARRAGALRGRSDRPAAACRASTISCCRCSTAPFPC